MANINRQQGGARGKKTGHLYEQALLDAPCSIHPLAVTASIVTGRVDAIDGNSRPTTESKPDLHITLSTGEELYVSVKKGGAAGYQIQLSCVDNYVNLFSMPVEAATVFRLWCGVGCIKDWTSFKTRYNIPNDVTPLYGERRQGRLHLETIQRVYNNDYIKFVEWMNDNKLLIATTLLAKGMAKNSAADHIFFEDYGLFNLGLFARAVEGDFEFSKTGSTFRLGLMSFQRYGHSGQGDSIQARLSKGAVKQAVEKYHAGEV